MIIIKCSLCKKEINSRCKICGGSGEIVKKSILDHIVEEQKADSLKRDTSDVDHPTKKLKEFYPEPNSGAKYAGVKIIGEGSCRCSLEIAYISLDLIVDIDGFTCSRTKFPWYYVE